MRTIQHGTEYWTLHADGGIERPNLVVGNAASWRVRGAVTRNNFGHVTRRYSLEDVLTEPGKIPWRFKNGKQRTFILDFDHGTNREWRVSPQAIW